jgi:hypothetical protein
MAGCKKSGTEPAEDKSQTTSSAAVDSIIVDTNIVDPNIADSNFPSFLAGVWTTDTAKWIFRFEPDGEISKFRHFVGMDFDVAKGSLREDWHVGAEAFYVLGICETQYHPESREFSVMVNIDHYTITFPGREDLAMEGKFEDYLTGTVSEDGNEWNPTWINKSLIIGSGESEPEPEKIKFYKVSRDKEDMDFDQL